MTRTLFLLISAGLILSACSQKAADNDDAPDMIMAAPHSYSAEEKATIQATFPAPYNTADLAAGEIQFNKCRACHSVGPDKMNLVGPHLYGVFGRKSGTEPGYTFSEAMTAHNVTWDFDTLDAYLAAPQAVVKGTKMSYQGIPKETDRHNLIAWLKMETTPYAPSAGAADSASSAP
ncbi:MAG: cytochrome c family protein [Asticcacaulis sp.]|uniref:c-type cytochrome n=1 Tax=Asticcacaulis sp. TaxID=1872648 RepID=UPI0039E227BF